MSVICPPTGGARYRKRDDLCRKGSFQRPYRAPLPRQRVHTRFCVMPAPEGVSGTFEVFLSRTNILARCLRQRRFSACLRSKHCCMAPLTQANGAGVGTGSREEGIQGRRCYLGNGEGERRHIRTLYHRQNVAPSWRLVGQLFKVACFCLQRLQTGQHRVPVFRSPP